MAAAKFSRDVLEQNQTITTDLIDFETIIETPQQEEKKAAQFLNFELQKFRNSEFEKYLEETRGVPLFARGKNLQPLRLVEDREERKMRKALQTILLQHPQ